LDNAIGLLLMDPALVTLMCVLVGLLLAYTTWAAVVGVAGLLTRARYKQCPQCHHHYLTPAGSGDRHHCPHGVLERTFAAAWHLTHHTATQPKP